MSFHSAVALAMTFAIVGCEGCGGNAQTHAPSSRRPAVATATRSNEIIAHEWAVFRRQSGRVNHLEQLAEECPPFVVRMDRAPLRGEVIADKPVLFLYGAAPSVRVEVTYTNGTPWLAYPPPENSSPSADGVADEESRDRTADDLASPRVLTWNGSLSTTPRDLLPAGGFWPALRNVGASTFTTAAGASERFIYYDGPVEIAFPLGLANGMVTTVTPSGHFSEDVWLVRRNGGDHMRWAGTHGEHAYLQMWHVARTLDPTALRADLKATVMAKGLTDAEVESLLTVWAHDLFEYDGLQIVYVLTPSLYEEALPLRIEPRPSDLIRVALVIERG